MHLLPRPSDPAGALCGRQCTPDRIVQIENDLGLNKPKTEQFVTYTKGLVVGNDLGGKKCDAPCLGWSYVQNRPVTDMVKQAFPVTVSIVIGGIVVYSTLGILFGMIAARFRGKPLDRIIVGVSQFVTSIPYFVLAQLFFLYAMVFYAIIPRAKYTSILDNPFSWFVGLVGIWLFYGTVLSANYVRYVRASMIDVQNQDYIRTARSKGLGERKIAISHALRAGIAPFLTLLGLAVASELGGAIFTEQIFGLSGMGRLAITSFGNSDLPVIAGVVVVGAVIIVFLNLLVDLLYGLVDPRVKLS
ncbi:ABC transporter permease [Luteipulveratus flavus]|uniref:ABC transporter permease n=1 Tax=Luteipulveratus flavus TaxID=3031728 RepID=UPI00319E64B7